MILETQRKEAAMNLEYELEHYQTLSALFQEIVFAYTSVPPTLLLSGWGAEKAGLSRVTANPAADSRLLSLFGERTLHSIADTFVQSTPGRSLRMDVALNLGKTICWHRISWHPVQTENGSIIIGKIANIHEEYIRISALRHLATSDVLTGLTNHTYAKECIRQRLSSQQDTDFALILMDIDFFKTANDQYGHIFGDHVLRYTAGKLRSAVLGSDIAARVGGDEFMVFLEDRGSLEEIVNRIFLALTGEYRGFPVSVSMGIARTDTAGRSYNTLFHCADQALYAAKQEGRGRHVFYHAGIDSLPRQV